MAKETAMVIASRPAVNARGKRAGFMLDSVDRSGP
jgi:hypothetical protein